MSLAVSLQAAAAVKWNNTADDGKAVNYQKGGLPTLLESAVQMTQRYRCMKKDE